MSDLLRHATEHARNAERLTSWHERWRLRFGHYPASASRPLSIEQIAEVARQAGATVPRAQILMHPMYFDERHGNGCVRKFPRHKHQRHAAPLAPEEMA